MRQWSSFNVTGWNQAKGRPFSIKQKDSNLSSPTFDLSTLGRINRRLLCLCNSSIWSIFIAAFGSSPGDFLRHLKSRTLTKDELMDLHRASEAATQSQMWDDVSSCAQPALLRLRRLHFVLRWKKTVPPPPPFCLLCVRFWLLLFLLADPSGKENSIFSQALFAVGAHCMIAANIIVTVWYENRSGETGRWNLSSTTPTSSSVLLSFVVFNGP